MKNLSALALAGLLAAPGAFAAEVEFGGDFDFDYFNVVDGTGPAGADNATGFRQRIRLQSKFDAGNGVEVHTRLNLFNDRWTGDASGNPGAGADERPFTAGNRGHRTVELDYGFVRLPFGPGVLSVGRQISNWSNNFTAADDRRDRIGYATRIAGQILSISYDRRAAGATDDREGDGNQLNVAMLGALGGGWNYGLLATKWDAGGTPGTYALRGATLVAPYVSGSAGPVDLTIGGHYLGSSRGSLFTEDTTGVYVRVGTDLSSVLRLEGQAVSADGGTLVAGGFDTFSSLIHNSPDHSVSASRIAGLNLSGLGTEAEEDDSRMLVAVRAVIQLNPQLTLTPAVGRVTYDRVSAGDVDEDVTFFDLRADYQLYPSTSLFATAGLAQSEDYFQAQGNPDGKDAYAVVTGLNVQF